MHKYILGSSGTGKSTFQKSLIVDNIKNGEAVIFIDPHGHDADDLLRYIPQKHIHRTIYFDFSNRTHVFCWNVLNECANPYLASDMLASAIKHSSGYGHLPTPQMTMYLRNIFASLILNNESFLDSLSVLKDGTSVDHNWVLESFWQSYNKKPEKDKAQETSSVLNKLYLLLLDPHYQQFFAIRQSKFHLQKAVNQDVFIVKLPQGQLGLEMVSLMGSFILSLIHLSAINRDTSIPLNIYIDEVHTFASTTIAEMLSGLRKFNVNITVAHQFIDQLDKELFTSLQGNCEDRCIFRVSKEDADRLTPRQPSHGRTNLDELPDYTYRQLPFRLTDKDIPVIPLENPNDRTPQRVVDNSILKYYKAV